jgi:hypothetical protein
MSTTTESFRIEILGTEAQISELGKLETSLKNLSKFRNQYNKDVEAARKTDEEYGKALAKLDKLFAQGKVSQEDYASTLDKLNKDQKAATSILENESKVRGKITAEQKALTNSKGLLLKSIKEENAELKVAQGSYRALQLELTRLDRQYKALSDTERESEFGKNLAGEVKGLRDTLKGLDAEIGSNQRSVGDYGIVWEKLKGQLGPFGGVIEGIVAKLTTQNATIATTGTTAGAASAGVFTLSGAVRALGVAIKNIPVAGWILAAVGALGAAGAKLVSYNNELGQSLVLTEQLTKLQGDSLRALQGQVQATAEVFEKDYREVLIATNATAEAFGITQEEAAKSIQTGFALGADASDEFLDILKEYGPQFNNLGLSADQFISIIDKQVEQGVFSDKGVDAIKEAGLALRELTAPAREALEAIGISADTLEKELRDGTKTYADAIAQVSTALGGLDRQSPEVGQAIADIFKGAGEDAGLDYILTLKDINQTTGDLIDGASEYEKTQIELVQVQAKYNEVVSATFGSGAEGWQLLKTRAEVFLKEGIIKIIEGTVGIINYFRDLYNESLIFRQSVVSLKLPFIILGTVASGVLDGVLASLRNVGESIRAILTGDFSGFVESVKKTYSDTGDAFYKIGAGIAEDFVDGANEVFNGDKLEPIKLDFVSEVPAGPNSSGGGSGRVAKTKEELEAQQKAIDEAAKLKKQKEELLAKQLEQIRADLLKTEITALKAGLEEKVELEELSFREREKFLKDLRKEAEGDVDAQRDIDRLLELQTTEHIETVGEIIKGGTREQLEFYISSLTKVKDLTEEQQKALAQSQEALLALGTEPNETSFLASSLGLTQEQFDTYSGLASQFTSGLMDTLSENRRQRIEEDLAFEQAAIGRASENELTALEARYNNGLISSRTYEVERARIEKEAEEKRLQAAKKAGEAKKALAKKEAAIDLASALISILAKSPDILKPIGPLYAAQVVQALAAYAFQLSSINKQKFEFGGRVRGPRHSAGGVPFSIRGGGQAEMEGDEFVIRRSAILSKAKGTFTGTALEVAEQINRLGRGSSKNSLGARYEGGGRVPKPPSNIDQAGGMTIEAFKDAMSQALRDNRAVLPVDQLSSKQNEVELIETARRWQ